MHRLEHQAPVFAGHVEDALGPQDVGALGLQQLVAPSGGRLTSFVFQRTVGVLQNGAVGLCSVLLLLLLSLSLTLSLLRVWLACGLSSVPMHFISWL